MEDESGLSLFAIFIEGFHVSAIYEVGWLAAREWMAIVSGILLAIAITIRSVEEKVNLLTGGQGGCMKMIVNVLIIACAMGMYFVITGLIINLFNALYGVLENSQIVEMGNKLDSVMNELRSKDHKFAWSEVGDSIFSAFAMIAYWLTHMILILVTLAMRIAHALLVSWCIFYGAVALPMSVTTGLKMLTPLRNLAIMVLLWPIVESFFMFAISGSFTLLLSSSSLDVSQFKTWNMGLMVFYLAAFSIINLLLAAALVAAPLVARGLANGSGNVSGVVGAFAGAGITAGIVAAKTFMPKPVVSGAQNSILGSLSRSSTTGGGSPASRQPLQIGSKVNNGEGTSRQGGKGSYKSACSDSSTATSSSVKSSGGTSNASGAAVTASASKGANNVQATSLEKNLSKKDKANIADGTLSSKQPESAGSLQSGELTEEQRKKRSRAARSGHFVNKAKTNPKQPPQ